MAANRSFFKKIFGEPGAKKEQKAEFIRELEQIDRNDAQALKGYLNQNKKMLAQQFGPEKHSLLHWACFQLENDSLCSEIVEFLLQRGGKVNQQNSDGETPLHIAAQQHLLCPEDSTHTIELLIKKDADPTIKNNKGQAPFSAPNFLETPPELIKILSSSRYIVSDFGGANLLLAATYRYPDIVDTLYERYTKPHKNIHSSEDFNINMRDRDGNTLLHLASGCSNRALMALFLQKGADINAINHSGFTPLHYAVWDGNRASVEFLLAQGADAFLKNSNRNTALHFAIEIGHITLVPILIKSIDLKARNSEGLTALHIAVMDNDLELIKFLLNNGADINATDHEGNTPLHMTIIKHSKKIRYFFAPPILIKFLLERQAKIVKNNDGHTPIYYARNHNESLQFAILQEAEREAELEKIWEMESSQFVSFFQWLPKEIKGDIKEMVKKLPSQEDNIEEDREESFLPITRLWTR